MTERLPHYDAGRIDDPVLAMIYEDIRQSLSAADQSTAAGLRDLADEVWGLFDELMTRGFSRHEALQLTQTFMVVCVTLSREGE